MQISPVQLLLAPLSLAVSVFFFLSPASAKVDGNCFPIERVQRELSEIEFRYTNASYQHCDLDNAGYQLAKALLFIKDLSLKPFDGTSSFSTLHRLSGGPWKFFVDRVRVVQIDGAAAKCKDGTGGWFSSSRPGEITVCAKTPYLQRVEGPAQILVHEAAHAEPAPGGVSANAHTQCTRRVYTMPVTHGACDTSMNQGGAYAVETEFAIGVSRREDVPANVRTAFREFAKSNLRTRFNVLTGDLKHYVALVRQDDQVDFYDGVTARSFGKTPTGFLPVLNDPLGLVFEKRTHQILKRIRAQEMSCELHKTKVVCWPHGSVELERSISITGISAINIVEIEAADRFFGVGAEKQIFLLTQDGKMIPVPSRWALFKATRKLEKGSTTDALGLTTWRTAKFRPFLLKLGNSGRVSLLEYARDEVDAPGANGSSVKDIVGPFVWSPSLEAL